MQQARGQDLGLEAGNEEGLRNPEMVTTSAVIKLHLVFRASLNMRSYANILSCKFMYLTDM